MKHALAGLFLVGGFSGTINPVMSAESESRYINIRNTDSGWVQGGALVFALDNGGNGAFNTLLLPFSSPINQVRPWKRGRFTFRHLVIVMRLAQLMQQQNLAVIQLKIRSVLSLLKLMKPRRMAHGMHFHYQFLTLNIINR